MLYVLLFKQLIPIVPVGTERADQAQFMCRMCFSPFKPYLQLRETLQQQYLCWGIVNCGQRKISYRSWSEDWHMHPSQKRKLPLASLCFSNNVLDPIRTLSNIRALCCQIPSRDGSGHESNSCRWPPSPTHLVFMAISRCFCNVGYL